MKPGSYLEFLFLTLFFLAFGKVSTQPLSVTMSSTNITCNGAYDGTATATPSGGTPPYYYYWGPWFPPTSTITNLWPGTYDVTITDEASNNVYGSVGVTEPPGMVLTPTITGVSCYGGNDGSILLSLMGGDSPYYIEWSNGETGNFISDLTNGNYTVTVTDDSDCTKTASYLVPQPPLINISLVNSGDEICSGAEDGYITISVIGGVNPIIAEWSNGSTGLAISNLSPDSYTVTVTDNNDCTKTATYIIDEGATVEVALLEIQTVTCHGGTNGSMSVEASGGSTPYDYIWSNGYSGYSISNLAAGTYTVTVTDNANCEAISDFEMTQPDELVLDLIDLFHESCSGVEDGSITINVEGGVNPISIEWSNGLNTTTISNLEPGSYSVTVTDNNDCVEVATYTINPGATVILSLLDLHDVSCYGGSDGSISVNAIGGESPYTYLWSNGMTEPSIEELVAGNYQVTVTDFNGCDDFYEYTISEPTALSVAISQTSQNLCFGDTTADLTTNVTGGTPNYSGLWSDGSTGLNNLDLGAGQYTITITDANSCIASQSVVINEPPLLTASVSATDETSSGANDGTATVTSAGGIPAYSFLWSNGGTTSTIAGLVPGTYTATVTDLNGCSSSASEQVFAFGCSLDIISATDNFICEDVTITLTPEVLGASGNVSYLWFDGSTADTLVVNEGGEYCLTVTDESNCQDIDCIVITESSIPPLTCPVVNESTSGANDGAIQCDGIPGIVSYLWSTGDTTAIITGLSPGYYWVIVSNANGCIRFQSFFVHSGNCQLNINSILTNIDCYGQANGSISLDVTGGTMPIEYEWSIGLNTPTISNLSSGNYDVTVEDAEGCEYNQSFTITEPTEVQINVDSIAPADDLGSGLIWIEVIGGTPPYTYLWLDPSGDTLNTEDLNQLTESGYYSLTVIDTIGCISIRDSIFVDEKVAVEPTPLFLSLKVYPVPADNVLFIDTKNPIREMVISGADGRLHKRIINPGSAKMDISDLGPGWYILRIYDGHEWYLARMVK